MKKIVLSSSPQISQLITNNPALLNVPGLLALKPLVEKAKKKAGCIQCNSPVAKEVSIRPQLEVALSNMTNQDYLTMKRLLQVDELCYYHKVNGKLTVTCV